ncbi:hypothetical protein A2U01_0095964, partial [Trifolium medium]|nr:hypothetical protein [Trifolium medium]
MVKVNLVEVELAMLTLVVLELEQAWWWSSVLT